MTSTEVTYGALNNKIKRRGIETVNLTEISVKLGTIRLLSALLPSLQGLANAGMSLLSKRPGGGGTRYIKKVGMLVENFEIDP